MKKDSYDNNIVVPDNHKDPDRPANVATKQKVNVGLRMAVNEEGLKS